MSKIDKRRTHRVSVCTTQGEVLWTRDMTEDEYDRWLDRRRKRTEARLAGGS